MRIALASLAFPTSHGDAISQMELALAEAAAAGARIVCTPECYLPGLRGVGVPVLPHSETLIAEGLARLSACSAKHGVGLLVGSEVKLHVGLVPTVFVIAPDGRLLGRQDKIQIPPEEEINYAAGHGRAVFTIDDLTFGIAICHEGWRYPETVRWAARRGAKIVFHPHYGATDPSGYQPKHWVDPANSFHEKAAVCRAVENDIYFAIVNYAIADGVTTSAVIDPNGKLIACQPRGEAGLLIVDIDPCAATGLLASRLRPNAYTDSTSLDEVAPSGKLQPA